MNRDWPDVLGGLALAGIGGLALGWALGHYDLGTLRQMGPGFFPAVLGGLLLGLGLIVALPALVRPGEAPRIDLGSVAAVLGAILIFGFGLRLLGLALATAASVLVASLAAPHAGWRWRVLLALAVTAITLVVFSLGLRMTLPLWPRLP
ncbi:tripartite tricarboxylate transporter TctB family protein [Roseicyclus sp.]|uniref:tripartite tricarboxylate transporter TctB family protein n=1 Tax=Roseicyclus sp. TaxID=1914329 RepID=UPI003F9ED881